MTSCTIIISHYESISFLRACVRQIRKYAHPEIEQIIYISEQSGEETKEKVIKEFASQDDIVICNMAPLYSGYGIDAIMQQVGAHYKYVAQLHVDAMPIHKNWLYLPIKMIEEYELSFVGQLQFIANGNDSIYPPHPFFCMAQCFNVARLTTYEEMSYNAGFTRFHERPYVEHAMGWANRDWAMWAKKDYNARGSDDDVVAFAWQDKYKQDDKLGLAITGYIAPPYGRLIEDIVFHFGSARESIGTGDSMGEQYKEFTRRINEDYSDELIEEMVSLAKKNQPPQMEILRRNLWDGKLKQSSPPPDELNKRIEELKNGL